MDHISIRGLKIFARHGVYEEETKNGQNFYVNAKLFVDMEKSGRTDRLKDAVDYGQVCGCITDFLTENTYQLLEKAVTETIYAVLNRFPLLNGMEMELCKPEAPIGLPFENVSVTRRMDWHEVYLSIGSNLGDKKAYLDLGVDRLKQEPGIRGMVCSKYLVTKPYGGVEQDDFLNGAVRLETLLSPAELLELLHGIEAEAGRKRELHWGPRTLDLDILLYDQLIMDTRELVIPHADMQNREFVLKPLCELAPYIRHPLLKRSMRELLDSLLQTRPCADPGGMLELK